MGVYIDYADVQAATDAQVLERLTDELSPGTSNQDYVNNRIEMREATFEGYASRQYPDLTALRLAKPVQAQLWIVAMVRYDLYGRRSVPSHVESEYLRTLEQLDVFARTGIPALIVIPPVATSAGTIKNSMTSEDQEVFPWQTENIRSVFVGMK